jgi:hypothetical protein
VIGKSGSSLSIVSKRAPPRWFSSTDLTNKRSLRKSETVELTNTVRSIFVSQNARMKGNRIIPLLELEYHTY